MDAILKTQEIREEKFKVPAKEPDSRSAHRHSLMTLTTGLRGTVNTIYREMMSNTKA